MNVNYMSYMLRDVNLLEWVAAIDSIIVIATGIIGFVYLNRKNQEAQKKLDALIDLAAAQHTANEIMNQQVRVLVKANEIWTELSLSVQSGIEQNIEHEAKLTKMRAEQWKVDHLPIFRLINSHPNPHGGRHFVLINDGKGDAKNIYVTNIQDVDAPTNSEISVQFNNSQKQNKNTKVGHELGLNAHPEDVNLDRSMLTYNAYLYYEDIGGNGYRQRLFKGPGGMFNLEQQEPVSEID